jgi:hypothetical protein
MPHFDREIRFVAAFVSLIIVVFGGFIAWKVYEREQYRDWLHNLVGALRNAEEIERERLMADTWGGATPQETLRLYIEAVEEGDYELAARYLIEKEREDELRELRELEQNVNLASYLDILRKAENDGEEINNSFRMKSKVGEGPFYFIQFAKYPNGIWKIVEI